MRIKKHPKSTVIIFAWVIVFSLMACSSKISVRYSPMKQIDSHSKPISEVDVYITNKPSDRYDEIGILNMKVWSVSQDELVAIQEFKKYAAQIGADGIIMMPSRTGSAANSYTKVTYAFTDFRAMVIRYLDGNQ